MQNDVMVSVKSAIMYGVVCFAGCY